MAIKLAGARVAARQLRRDQRGGIALTTAICLVPLIMAVGVAIEVSNWTVVKAELQSAVDLAALAGTKEYLLNSDLQNTLNAAADMAELNGAQGGTSRTLDSSNTLTDNQITAQVTNGTRQRPSKIIKVVARRTVPLMLTSIMGSTSPVTVAAAGWANASVAVQPCVLAPWTAGGRASPPRAAHL